MAQYTWASCSTDGIAFLYCSKEEIQQHSEELAERIDRAHRVKGTRDNHCYKSAGLGTLHVSRISGDTTFFTAKVGDADDIPAVSKPVKLAADDQAGQYVACMYDVLLFNYTENSINSINDNISNISRFTTFQVQQQHPMTW